MKVWFPTIKAGSGSDYFTERLTGGLKRKGIDTCITWFNNYFEIFPFLMKFTDIPEGADIIHTNIRNGFPFKGRKRKLVITIHSCIHDESCRKYKTIPQKIYHDLLIHKFESLSIKAADKIVAVSNYISRKCMEIFPPHESGVIYNGVDTEYFSPLDYHHNNKKFRLLYVGNTRRLKGYDLLYPIMERLGNKFILNFTGGTKPGVGRITDNMHDIGRLDQNALLQAYRDCDALIFPTRHEGFGYAVCEAMSCGKPVIVSDNTSMPELVKHDETGILCPTDNVDAFVNAVRKLKVDPDLARQMGQAGRERVLANFTIEKMAGEYVRLYESLL